MRHVSRNERNGRARGKETAERASVVKRYIDISRLIVLAISHARALHLAKRKNRRQEKTSTISRYWTRPNDVSISLSLFLSLVHIPQFVTIIIVVIAGDCVDVGFVTRFRDTFRIGDGDNPRRRSDRLQFPRRRKTAAIHAPLLLGILEVRPGDGMVYAVPFRATLGRA